MTYTESVERCDVESQDRAGYALLALQALYYSRLDYRLLVRLIIKHNHLTKHGQIERGSYE